MRRLFRLLNVVTAAACLASGAAATWSWLVDPGYRAHYGDPLWLLLAYVAFYAWVLRAFWRDDASAPRLALVKTAGAYLFLVYLVLGATTGEGAAWLALWMHRTPGRYVYQLFQWGPCLEWVLMAYVLLGRGAWNTVNAVAFTMPWWIRIRASRPILGRVLTALPVLLLVGFAWTYRELIRLQREVYSCEATSVAHEVLAGIDCEALAHASAPTTTDLRQRGERRYEVHIRWDCHDVQVLVRDPDGRVGTARAPRLECCPNPSPG